MSPVPAPPVGTPEHMQSRFRAWVKAGNPPDRFLANYNRNRGTSFTESDLGPLVGTTLHLAERYNAWVAAGHDPERFLVNYNRNRNTGFTGADLQAAIAGTADQPNRDAYATILDLLKGYGLESLSGWLWEQILNDVPESEIFINLRQTDAYKTRFPGMASRSAAGLRALSEHEYIQMEEGYRNVLRNVAGVGPGRYDKPSDFIEYFSRDISVDEAAERAEMWRMLTKAPQLNARIKGMFRTFTKTGEVSDGQLFEMMVQEDHPLMQELVDGVTRNTAIKTLSLANMKETLNRAMALEASNFAGGGGQAAESQGLKVGFSSAKTERFT